MKFDNNKKVVILDKNDKCFAALNVTEIESWNLDKAIASLYSKQINSIKFYIELAQLIIWQMQCSGSTRVPDYESILSVLEGNISLHQAFFTESLKDSIEPYKLNPLEYTSNPEDNFLAIVKSLDALIRKIWIDYNKEIAKAAQELSRQEYELSRQEYNKSAFFANTKQQSSKNSSFEIEHDGNLLKVSGKLAALKNIQALLEKQNIKTLLDEQNAKLITNATTEDFTKLPFNLVKDLIPLLKESNSASPSLTT